MPPTISDFKSLNMNKPKSVNESLSNARGNDASLIKFSEADKCCKRNYFFGQIPDQSVQEIYVMCGRNLSHGCQKFKIFSRNRTKRIKYDPVIFTSIKYDPVIFTSIIGHN
jgi:hypothetical protein